MKQLKEFQIKPLPTQDLPRSNKTILQRASHGFPQESSPLGKAKHVGLSPRKQINQGQRGAVILSSAWGKRLVNAGSSGRLGRQEQPRLWRMDPRAHP